MKNIIIGLIIGASILGGCSVKESSSTTTSSSTGEGVDKSIITYSISPQKNLYDPGESFTITANIEGPTEVDGAPVTVAWGTRTDSETPLPQQSSDTLTLRGSASLKNGGVVQITARPKRTSQIDGVNRIEGSATFNIITRSLELEPNIYTFNISRDNSDDSQPTEEGSQPSGNIIIGAFLIDKETEATYGMGFINFDSAAEADLLSGVSLDVDMTELKIDHNLEDGDYGVFVYAWGTSSFHYRYTEMSFDFSATQGDPKEVTLLNDFVGCIQSVTLPTEATSLVGKVDDVGILDTVSQQIADITKSDDYKNEYTYEGVVIGDKFYFGFICPSDTGFPSWATYQPTITYYASNQDGIEYDGTNLSNYEELGSYTPLSNLLYNPNDLDGNGNYWIEDLDFSSHEFQTDSPATTNQ